MAVLTTHWQPKPGEFEALDPIRHSKGSAMRFLELVVFTIVIPTLLSAFKAYWNFPSGACKKDHAIDFQSYKIETNENLNFYGKKVVIFYEFIFGRYPYYKDYDENQPVNGGTPQNCSLTDHLDIAEQNITQKIPDDNFDGLAIIDLEEWRPLFDQNFWGKKSVFRNQSIAIARAKNPGIQDEKQIEKIAEKEFNDAARKFFVDTIRLGRSLRKNAKWGFYGFPYCNYDAGKNGEHECWKKYQDWNDKMMFLFNESNALYPSIYLGSSALSSDQRFRYVQAILKEARRIANKFTPPLPIYAYTKIEYDPLKEIDKFYDEHDLCSTIKQPADLGIDGIIIWSSSANMLARCPQIQKNMDGGIGL
ncbi:hyaluronoglucosaminidase [Ancylostoma duodenale]|uniref:Hyaluronidase n=1 Tax=Ancylostoma duodenale TaxID=51022 RepID=A0A0C2FKM6_9BILA|nr:hyaluronoglucosaminidase [Ancylostoma duodenale]